MLTPKSFARSVALNACSFVFRVSICRISSAQKNVPYEFLKFHLSRAYLSSFKLCPYYD